MKNTQTRIMALVLSIVMMMCIMPTTIVAASTDVTIFLNGARVQNPDVYYDNAGEILLRQGVQSARTIFPSNTDWSLLTTNDVIALKWVAQAFGYEFRQDGRTAYLTGGDQQIIIDPVIYLNGTMLRTPDVIYDSSGELILPRGITSARTVFPSNSNWSALGNSTQPIALKFVAPLLGYEFRQDGNYGYLTVEAVGIFPMPATVYLNNVLVNNADVQVDAAGEFILPRGITSARTVFPTNTNWSAIGNSNQPTALKFVAEALGYTVRQEGTTVYLSNNGITNNNVQFRKNNMVVSVSYSVQNGIIAVNKGTLQQLFARELENTTLPDGNWYDLQRYAEYFGYRVVRYQNYFFFNNNNVRPIMVSVDGVVVDFPDQQPLIKDSRTLVPVAVIARALGGRADWNGTSQLATIYNGTTTVEIFIGQRTYYINRNPYTLDVPAEIIGQRTMIPLRAAGEALGYNVEWVPGTEIDWIRMTRN